MTSEFSKGLAAAAVLAISASSQAITVGSYRGDLGDYVDCDKNSLTMAACEVAQDEINRLLERYDYPVTIDRNLFTYSQSMSERLTSSCSRRTFLTGASVRVDIQEGTGVQLTGNLIDEPVVFAATLNTRNYVRFNLKDNLGISSLFGCSKIGDDHYYADATSYLNTELVTFFSLEPRLKQAPNGDFIIEIKPIFDLRSNINLDVTDFDIHGASAFASLFANLSSRVHYLDGIANTVLSGGNSQEIMMAAADPLVQTVYGTILTNFSFGDPLELEHHVKKWAEDYANDSVSEINARTFDVTRDINSRIKSALQLDANGRAYFAFNAQLQKIPVTEAHKALLTCGNGQSYPISSGATFTNVCGKYAVGIPWQLMGPITSRSGTLTETFTDASGTVSMKSYSIGTQNAYSFKKTQTGTYKYSTRLCYEYLNDPNSRSCSTSGTASVVVTNVN